MGLWLYSCSIENRLGSFFCFVFTKNGAWFMSSLQLRERRIVERKLYN